MPTARTKSRIQPMRYAHPFFTATPPDRRAPSPLLHAARMSDWVSQKLGPIPKPTRTPVMTLAEIIGAPGVKEIQDAGSIIFHALGDAGRPGGSSPQEEIALHMTNEYSTAAGANNPAFFLHLGDVIYGHEKETLYRDEFYRPYKNYPGKIIAVAGNHDGEIFRQTDPKPLEAFLANFGAKQAVVPPVADEVRIFRTTMTQPGVYWLLSAPFLQMILLYSNIAEGPGYLVGAKNDKSQLNWLQATLSGIAKERKSGKRNALILAVHHPPYSNGGHAGSPDMLKAIDEACQGAGVWPDAVLSGHAHNYQRHTRIVPAGGKELQIPFIVAGCGGHNDSSVEAATGQKSGDHTYVKSRKGYGYLQVQVSAKELAVRMNAVPGNVGVTAFDEVVVDLATNQITKG
jgi:hypothetical protein